MRFHLPHIRSLHFPSQASHSEIVQSETVSEPIVSDIPKPRFYQRFAIARPRWKRPRFAYNANKILTYLFVTALMLLSFFAGGKYAPNGDVPLAYEDQRALAPKAKASQTLNKVLTISLKNNEGKEVSKIKYIIETAELQDEIIVKGQRARTVKGRTFLIFNIKIANQHNQAIEINSRDYIRVMVNNKPDLFAPDIHNDPIQVQAISTKPSRLGLPINDSDQNITVQIGELNGKKEVIKLDLKKV